MHLTNQGQVFARTINHLMSIHFSCNRSIKEGILRAPQIAPLAFILLACFCAFRAFARRRPVAACADSVELCGEAYPRKRPRKAPNQGIYAIWTAFQAWAVHATAVAGFRRFWQAHPKVEIPASFGGNEPRQLFWLSGFRAPCGGFLRQIPLCLLISGCAATIPAPTVVRTVEVQVPGPPVPCRVTLPEKPLWELDRTSPDAGIFELVRAAVIELKQRQQYQILLEAAARSCSD